MQILALQCYLTTVIWLPPCYVKTLSLAAEQLWFFDPHRFHSPPLLLRFRSQRATSQGSFLHQYEENRNQNQYVNRGRNHSADHRSGNRLHDVGTNTTRPENGNQAGDNGGDRHQLWPEPMHSALHGGLGNIGRW